MALVNVSRWQLRLPIGYGAHGRFVTLREHLDGAALVPWRKLSARRRRDLVIARLAALPRFKVSTGEGRLDRGQAIRALLENAPVAKLLIEVERGCVQALLRRMG